MRWLRLLSARLSRWVLHAACACLALLGLVVVYGVVLRYAFNAAQPYVEQVALLMVISVAMFGAAAGVHDAGHIGLDSVVRRLPERVRRAIGAIVDFLVLAFALLLLWGSAHMAESTWNNTIPTLGISEAFRYVPPVGAGLLIGLFSLERLIALR
ncbi:MAG: TRAP transporter small permease, partial [Rhizobacter sp.]|nr:TRAP transporter small permease [Rhizobacter sp.]